MGDIIVDEQGCQASEKVSPKLSNLAEHHTIIDRPHGGTESPIVGEGKS